MRTYIKAIKDLFKTFPLNMYVAAGIFFVVFSCLNIYLTSLVSKNDEIIREQYTVIHRYTAGISEAIPAIAKLDDRVNELIVQNAYAKTFAFTLLFFSLALVLGSAAYIYQYASKRENELVKELEELSRNDNLRTYLSEKQTDKELRETINLVLKQRILAIEDANALLQHVYRMSFDNLKSVSAISTRLNQQDSEASKVAAAVNNISGTAKQLVNNSNKVISASNSAQENLSRTKNTLVNLRKTVDFLKLDFSSASELINEVTNIVKDLATFEQDLEAIASLSKLFVVNTSLEASKGVSDSFLANLSKELGELAAKSSVAANKVSQMQSDISTRLNEVNEVVESGQERANENLNYVLSFASSLDAISTTVKNISVTLDKIKANEFSSGVNEEVSSFKNLSKDSISNISNVANIWQGQLELIKEYKEATTADED